MKPTTSYAHILKSSSILGASQIAVYFILIGRNKVAALLLGPAGVGTLGLFQTILTLVGTVSSLGISNSGVREIAEAHGSGDTRKVSQTCGILQRVALWTGVLGWLLAAALAYPISYAAFDNSHYAGSIAALGSFLLFSAVGTAYTAILQGTRRVGSLAKFQVLSTGLASVAAVALFVALGSRGIVPSLIVGAAISCGLACFLKKRVVGEVDATTWRVALHGSKKLVALGLAFMWNALTTSLVAFGIRAFVVRFHGLDSAGIYQAAWAISGMFAGFILQAMGTDFYPRLAGASGNHKEMGRLINEQTEIGLLLAGPGVLLTMGLAPYLMEWLYSAGFVAGAPLILWFSLGVFGQVVSWPLGFIQIAMGASRQFILTQTLFNGAHFGLVWVFVHTKGMEGIGMAYATLYAMYILGMLIYARCSIGFKWSRGMLKIIFWIAPLVATGFALAIFVGGVSGSVAGILLAAAAGVRCARELFLRLPPGSRLHAVLSKVPGLAGNRATE